MKENKERSLRETTAPYKTGWTDHMLRTSDNHYQVAGKPRKIRPEQIWGRNLPKFGLVLFVDFESNFNFQGI
jgi:hypothetical protein